MKKKLLVLFITFFIAMSLSAEEELFSLSAGISSGIPLYGAGSSTRYDKALPGNTRAIFGTVVSVNLNLIKQITLFAGNDNVFDLCWNSTEYVHKMHFSFPLGIKIYPGLGGLDIGLAYTLGFRFDYTNTTEFSEKKEFTSWGNGLKVLVEYNFAHEGKSKYYPTIGGYWNLMPRGNNSFDNLLVLYIAANF